MPQDGGDTFEPGHGGVTGDGVVGCLKACLGCHVLNEERHEECGGYPTISTVAICVGWWMEKEKDE